MPLTVHVWDFVDRKFYTIAPDATLGEAMEKMSEASKECAHTRSLVVVDKKRRPLGVISMRNILDAFKSEFKRWSSLLGKDGWAEALDKGLKECNFRFVEDYMVKVPSLKMGDDIIQAYLVLTEKKLEVRMVPVVEADEVVGVVRIPDLFDAFVEAYRKIA
ncbi:MAG: CBS domain-containing protein [Thermodesulfobacteriota bacterium]